MAAYTLTLLPVIGRSCRQLKQLDVECAWGTLAGPVEARLSSADSAVCCDDVIFPQLVALEVQDAMYGVQSQSPASSRRKLLRLLGLLHSAPALRFLTLGMRLDSSQLSLLSSLAALRGFDLTRREQELWQQPFFCSRDQPELPPSDWTAWQPVHEADREFELAAAMRRTGGLFRHDPESFDGRTGREAFFAALEARRIDSQRDETHRVQQRAEAEDESRTESSESERKEGHSEAG
jgi:hypothetical protein